MEPDEKMPEEGMDPMTLLAQRAERLEATAISCEEEAREQAEAVARLRARAEHCRELALEYRGAMLVVGNAPQRSRS